MLDRAESDDGLVIGRILNEWIGTFLSIIEVSCLDLPRRCSDTISVRICQPVRSGCITESSHPIFRSTSDTSTELILYHDIVSYRSNQEVA
jgi:hypothetical protein